MSFLSHSLSKMSGRDQKPYRKRCNGSCTHLMCDVISRNRPERNISFICESIALFERCYGSEYKEETREMALEAMNKYGPGTAFENDERMLQVYKILGKYSRSMSATDIYDRLYEKNLFYHSAQFYSDWTEAYIGTKGYEKAASIAVLAEKAIGFENPLVKHMWERLHRHKIIREHYLAPPQQFVGSVPVPMPIVKESPAPAPSARRALFDDHQQLLRPAQIASIPHAFVPPTSYVPTSVSSTLSKESIVLPTLSDIPPVTLDIVSPFHSGMTGNISHPPVFSFNYMHGSTMQSISMMGGPPLGLPSHPSAVMPSHPAQIHKDKINKESFASKAAQPVQSNFQDENAENKDPRPGAAPVARRVLTGVLQPSVDIQVDELHSSKAPCKESLLVSQEKTAPSAFEKKRNQQQHQQQSMAVRRIFTDPAKELENAMGAMGINSPANN